VESTTKSDAVKVDDDDTLAENMGNEKGTTDVARDKFNATALPVVFLEDNDNTGRRRPLTLSTGIAFDASLSPPAPYPFHLAGAVRG